MNSQISLKHSHSGTGTCRRVGKGVAVVFLLAPEWRTGCSCCGRRCCSDCQSDGCSGTTKDPWVGSSAKLSIIFFHYNITWIKCNHSKTKIEFTYEKGDRIFKLLTIKQHSCEALGHNYFLRNLGTLHLYSFLCQQFHKGVKHLVSLFVNGKIVSSSTHKIIQIIQLQSKHGVKKRRPLNWKLKKKYFRLVAYSLFELNYNPFE